jgi:alkylation response protein AidB-like acyl-CoA dehydrogenase
MDLPTLCERLRFAAAKLDQGNEQWPKEQMRWLAEAGVFSWFVPAEYGGTNYSEREQLDGYLAISEACLTTAFVLTQWNAACKRIAISANTGLQSKWLPGMARGELFATVGISHLTTSRQHLHAPVLSARPSDQGGFSLDGFSAWVTGAAEADVIVVGATLENRQQILCAVPRTRPGIASGAGTRLLALSASRTDAVHFKDVTVHAEELIAGPMDNVMQTGTGGGAGGLQTSTLAIGLTFAAVKFLQTEAQSRKELLPVAEKLAADAAQLRSTLFELAAGASLQGLVRFSHSEGSNEATPVKLREQANSLVLRATHAALAAAKGAGFVADHPAGRWCREALFFLVWSCPQPVLAANLCEFAQVS